MTIEQFDKYKHLFNVTSYKVAKQTGVSSSQLSQFSNGTKNLSADLHRKIRDYFTALAVERRQGGYFEMAWWFNDVAVVVEPIFEEETVAGCIEFYRIHVFRYSSWFWQKRRIAEYFFHKVEKPTWAMIEPYLFDYELEVKDNFL